MRRTLYFKDDDARLSFLTGNYITLTNLSERELQRIVDLRISPIRVSVHATEPALRAKLIGNPDAARGYELMQRLAAGGIEMECQIVCCPGLNDGEALSRSMRELSALYPQVNSVSVVPVGLTKHRERLPALTPFDRAHALETVRQVEAFGDECRKKHGSRIFFCSDELYLKAGLELPPDEWYEGYPQLENGVGLLRLLATEFLEGLSEGVKCGGKPFSIATGVAAAPFLRRLLAQAREKCVTINGEVYAVENDFLGHSIDVAGLVTGGDLIAQLRNKALGERLLIPVNMLRHGEGVFLDDVTLEDVTAALGVPVRVVQQDGKDLLEAMCGR
jgi:putative radical SAM enzyme (TIGR03279 family)